MKSNLFNSCKGGVPLSQLQSDYKRLVGVDIPLKDLGYSSLEYFLRDIPDVISLKRNEKGVFVAEGVADASTAHIAKLISKQKTSKFQQTQSIAS
ncbi:tdrd7a [Nephila pilipes]|uniref:Tdrd7a n=1 Tax=Nephila pilipes TaxID=299642 RepID=A0A8X6PUG6_NEPPI|nr:tdrd7a [Nephila pilipes]